MPLEGSGDRGSDDDGSSDDNSLIRADRLYSPGEVARLEGCCLASVYNRLSAGEYCAYKDGRSTRIPGLSILARRAAKLTPATFAPPRPPPSNFHTIQRAKSPRSARGGASKGRRGGDPKDLVGGRP